MSEKNTKAVKSFFNDYASKFHSIYREEQKNPLRRFFDRTVRYSMFKRFQKVSEIIEKSNSKKILDAGCGPGWHDILLVKSLNVNITGIDVAPEMIKIAQNECDKRSLESNLKFITANILEHNFNEKFEVIFALGVVEYFDDPVDLINKMKKICTKKILFSVPVLNHWLTPQRKIRYKIRNCPLWFYDEKKINALMSKVSIKNFFIHKIDRDYLVEITF
jgi:cyclopropane fatty-acyl-phospholipid synthase-like methyltransferase